MFRNLIISKSQSLKIFLKVLKSENLSIISVSSNNKNRNLSFLMTKFPISTIFRH